MRLTPSDISEFVASSLLAGACFIGVFTLALRFGLRPLLADWSKMRGQGGNALLEHRMSEMEEEIRQLKIGANLQLPADLRSDGRPRT